MTEVSSKLSESHPANPQAAQSPVAQAKPMLMSGSEGLVLPVSTNQMDMEHEHHKQSPEKQSTQKHSEHEHHDEQPGKEEKK
jgi:hypothetical protein